METWIIYRFERKYIKNEKGIDAMEKYWNEMKVHSNLSFRILNKTEML